MSIEKLTERINTNSNEYKSFWHRGVYLYNANDMTGAIADFKEAIKLRPDWALPYEWLGKCYQYAEKYTDAINEYDTAIKLSPYVASAYSQRAMCKQAVGDNAGYEQDIKKATDITDKLK